MKAVPFCNNGEKYGGASIRLKVCCSNQNMEVTTTNFKVYGSTSIFLAIQCYLIRNFLKLPRRRKQTHITVSCIFFFRIKIKSTLRKIIIIIQKRTKGPLKHGKVNIFIITEPAGEYF